MATRAFIAMVNESDISAIYTHWDGYPDHHLPILEKSFNTPERVKELISLGDLSILGNRIVPEIEFDTPERDVCVPYTARGEKLNITKAYTNPGLVNKAKHQGAEYLYTFKKDRLWYVMKLL
jgi:hypothetical protein